LLSGVTDELKRQGCKEKNLKPRLLPESKQVCKEHVPYWDMSKLKEQK
jgi:hypothetical protein